MERQILRGEHILMDRHIISSLTMEQGLPIHITPNPHPNSVFHKIWSQTDKWINDHFRYKSEKFDSIQQRAQAARDQSKDANPGCPKSWQLLFAGITFKKGLVLVIFYF